MQYPQLLTLRYPNFMNVKQLITLMNEKGIANPDDIAGIQNDDILRLEHFFGLTFPDTYRQFLLVFGRSAGALSPWMSIYFDDLKSIRTQFELLSATQSKEPNLPKSALIIAHWESIFDFIVCDNNPDPEVYRLDIFSQHEQIQQRHSNSYSEYLHDMIDNADTPSMPSDFFDDAVSSSIASPY